MQEYAWQTIGHTAIKQRFEQGLRAGNFPQAVLCIGPSGVGKATLVHEVAHFLGAETHSILEFDVAAGNIESFRDFLTTTTDLPAGARAQVVVLQHAESLTVVMANTLLKTLEEPPQHTYFFLLSAENNVLPTIRSRCATFYFGNLSAEDAQQVVAMHGGAPVGFEGLLSPGELLARVAAGTADALEVWKKEWATLVHADDFVRLLVSQRLAGEEVPVLQEKFTFWLRLQRMELHGPEAAHRLSVLAEALHRLKANANRKLVCEYVCLHV